MSQSVENPTLDVCSGLDLTVVSSSSTLGSSWAWRLLKKKKRKKRKEERKDKGPLKPGTTS